MALIKAAAACLGLRCISGTERAVIIDVIRWSPMESVTSAIRPLMRTSSADTNLVGRNYLWNNTFQYRVYRKVWPEVELNSAFLSGRKE